MNQLNTYLGNPLLKAARVQLPFTENQVKEYVKCSQDPVYFLENYGKVVSLDRGIVPFKLYPYQKRLITAIHQNPNVIGKLFRQAGKSTIIAGYICWYVLFNDQKTAVILANKEAIAKEIFSRVQFFIENLPMWLQQGVEEWNKKSFELENGSRCMCAASSPSAVRGMSINLLLCDEFAHMAPNLADEFIASVFPTVSSAKTSKMILISTPNGMNHYYKMWEDALKGKNGFVPIEGKWTEHPDRDQSWADKMKEQLGEVKYMQEVECSFVGSSFTLINGTKLSNIPYAEPNHKLENVKIYEKPTAGRSYVITVDTSRGQHLDYSAFVIFDITTMPYRVVATFKDNTMPTSVYPVLIHRFARLYNEAYILVEVNDIGGEISNVLWYDFEYENLYFTNKNEKLSEGRGYPGVRTTKKVKAIGCQTLKDLIENDQLLFSSFEIIQELSVFVVKRASYGADDTAINDDLTACLWLFAWMTKQPIFTALTNNDTRATLALNREKQITDSVVPFGYIVDASQEETTGLSEDQSFDDWFYQNGEDQLQVGQTIDDWIMK